MGNQSPYILTPVNTILLSLNFKNRYVNDYKLAVKLSYSECITEINSFGESNRFGIPNFI